MNSPVGFENAQAPDVFCELVEDALKHIYDLSYLHTHPLCKQLGFDNTAEIAGQTLRRELVKGIELLNPGEQVPFRAPHARLHSILVLHYMEQLTIQDTANQLGVSPRQALRNLREAERSVAEILWSRKASIPNQDEMNFLEISSVENEMMHLEASPRPVLLTQLVSNAVDAVRPRAEQREVQIENAVGRVPDLLHTNPVLAQQLLTSLLNYAVGQAEAGKLAILFSGGETDQELVIVYQVENNAVFGQPDNPMIAQFAQTLQWSIHQTDLPVNTRKLTLKLLTRCPTILIVDDNEGLVHLLQRYLSEKKCQVITALSGEEGLRLAKLHRPQAILLDVMMPGVQGWEVLQRLHHDPDTAAIPVIVCSVINEPELAQALGALMHVSKPIRQVDILNALQSIGVV